MTNSAQIITAFALSALVSTTSLADTPAPTNPPKNGTPQERKQPHNVAVNGSKDCQNETLDNTQSSFTNPIIIIRRDGSMTIEADCGKISLSPKP